MKLLLLSLLFSLTSLNVIAQDFVAIPELSSPVVDMGGFFTPEEKVQLENKIQSIFQQGLMQPQILTVETIGPESIEQFSIRVAEQWKLGGKESDNGLIFILSKAERKTRIEVGSGLEGDITDLQAHKMIQELMIPSFKKQAFANGFSQALDYSTAILGQDNKKMNELIQIKKKPEYAGLFAFVFYILVSFLFSFSRRKSRTKKGSWLRGLISAALFTLPFLALGLHNQIALGVLGLIGFIMGFFGFHQAGNYTSGGYHSRGGLGGGGSSSWGGGGGGFSGGGASGDW